jgi:N-ethylmaleimide reductase
MTAHSTRRKNAMEEVLFQPLALEGLTLENRIIMASMTRQRASRSGAPTDLMSAYFGQRASAGFMLTDCTMVGPLAHAYENCPGIYSLDQVVGWRQVTSAVHRNGGRIFAQLWHCGRRSHPLLLDGERPVAPSPIPDPGEIRTPMGKHRAPVPRALNTAEIHGVVEEFEAAARNARSAGFDGIELHGANGYLIDQFLREGSNRRADIYGGSASRRARFLLEIVEAVIGVWSAAKVGVKLSPGNSAHGMSDSDPVALFTDLVRELSARRIAYLHLFEPVGVAEAGVAADESLGHLRSAYFRPLFQGYLMANGGYDPVTAEAAIRDGKADLVSFARLFLANPDLPERIRQGAPLNRPDPATLYGGGARGYTDYPFLPGPEMVQS